MSGEEQQGGGRRIRTSRLEAFSDGVFAIAITLLVLELAVPVAAEADLLGAVLAEWPSFLAYVISFATIGVIWLAHSVITEFLTRVDAIFVRLNLLLLLVVSFLPYPTRLLAEYIASADAARVAATIYGVNLLSAAVLIAILWKYAIRAGLVRSDVADDDVLVITRAVTPGIAGYVALIAIGLVLPRVAVIGYLALAVVFLVPFSAFRRSARAG